jgi:hypothetical protein
VRRGRAGNLIAARQATAVARQAGQTALEQAPLGIVVAQRKRATVRLASLTWALESAQQLGARRVEVAILLERERLADQLAACGRARVALVEDQIDDRKHGREAIGSG